MILLWAAQIGFVERGDASGPEQHHEPYTVCRANSIAHHEVTRSRKSELGMVRAHIGKQTPREPEVFELVIRGQTNKQVANALGKPQALLKN